MPHTGLLSVAIELVTATIAFANYFVVTRASVCRDSSKLTIYQIYFGRLVAKLCVRSRRLATQECLGKLG